MADVSASTLLADPLLLAMVMPYVQADSNVIPTSTVRVVTASGMQRVRRDEVVTVVSQTRSVQGPDNTVVVSQTSTTYAPRPSPTQNPSENETKDDSDTPAGPVAGGVVGGVVGLALILAVAWFIYRRIKKNRATRALDDMYAETGMGGGGVDRHTRMRPAQTDMMPISSSWESDARTPAAASTAALGMPVNGYDSPIPVQRDSSRSAAAYALPGRLREQPVQEALSFTPADAERQGSATNIGLKEQSHPDGFVFDQQTFRVTNAEPEQDQEQETPSAHEIPLYAQEAEQAAQQNPQSGTLVSEVTRSPTDLEQATDPLYVNTSHLEQSGTVLDDERSPMSMYMWLPRHKLAGITSPGQSARTPAANSMTDS